MRFRDAVRAWRDTPVLKVSADPSDVESVTLRYLMYVLVPAWFVPGVADWVMHRKTRIERTSGLRESLVHALMMGEISVPVTLVLLCEVNPALLCLHWEQVANRGGWCHRPGCDGAGCRPPTSPPSSAAWRASSGFPTRRRPGAVPARCGRSD